MKIGGRVVSLILARGLCVAAFVRVSAGARLSQVSAGLKRS